ncbi:MAG: hypothetical protein ACI86M_002581 [Saprospiraceae bacterium]|jgi:hypothetical protein
MKLYTTLPSVLKSYFDKELQLFNNEYRSGNLDIAWNHLERAHIIGQRYPYAHSFVHWKMLQFGIRIKSTKEVIGQIPRLLFGGVKSFVGKVPVGNPGGANIPALKSFPLAEDIQDILLKAELN